MRETLAEGLPTGSDLLAADQDAAGILPRRSLSMGLRRSSADCSTGAGDDSRGQDGLRCNKVPVVTRRIPGGNPPSIVAECHTFGCFEASIASGAAVSC